MKKNKIQAIFDDVKNYVIANKAMAAFLGGLLLAIILILIKG